MRRELGADWISTELGPLFVACTEAGVCFVGLQPDAAREGFERWRRRHLPGLTLMSSDGPRPARLAVACRELQEFARGDRMSFDVPVDPFGSEFQCAVWDELTRIPFGATRTYAQVAQALGKPTAPRAVGMANNRNAVPVLIPCHRVVAARDLGGFGAGLEMKRRLLSLEGALLPFG